jgi:alginate O-acetyltransferase complex protein AlgI
MSFTSPAFIVFFLLFFWLWPGLRGRPRQLFLLGASYLFYASWSAPLLLLLVGSTLLDFSVARAIGGSEDPERRRRLLAVSIVGNLGVLGFFKYYGFFVESAAAGLHALGLDVGTSTLGIVLPVGISFYTFQTLGYTIDVYRRHLAPRTSPLDFALYVAYFPQLVAGPIERAGHLLPQLQRLAEPAPTAPRALEASGLIAARLLQEGGARRQPRPARRRRLRRPRRRLGPARPVAGHLRLRLPDLRRLLRLLRHRRRRRAPDGRLAHAVNFRAPYTALGPAELWRRWHISLSTWLRDYLYIPLGGNRRGPRPAPRETSCSPCSSAASGTAPPGTSCSGAPTTACCW